MKVQNSLSYPPNIGTLDLFLAVRLGGFNHHQEFQKNRVFHFMYDRVIQFGIFLWYMQKIYFSFKWRLRFWHYFLLESSKISSFRSPYCRSYLTFVAISCACTEVLTPCNKAWYEEKECINNIVTERYKRSSIPVMKKMLNEEDLRLKRAMQNINIVPREHCFINSISEKI